MTAVLPASPERQFSPDPLHSPVTQRYFLNSPSEVTIKSPLHQCSSRDCASSISSSASSSIPPSPTADHPPPSPTTLSSLSFSTNDDSDDADNIILPSFGPFMKKDLEPETQSDTSADTSTDHPLLDPSNRAADDSDISREPSRHVDYLSHEWREEDIWSSWRYVVARRSAYENGRRLENASWRTWAKLQLNRGTVSPEALNWLKDCDVTWLYGPLKTNREAPADISLPSSRLATPTFSMDRKPILKKRTASEAILQRSLSQHTLLQHAGAILKAQAAEYYRNRSPFPHTIPEFGRGLSSSAGCSRDGSSSNTTSGVESPGERRHIHFNNEVVQCIAVESEDGDDEEEMDENNSWPIALDENSFSDDVLMMRRLSSGQTSGSGRSTPRNSYGGDNKTIAPLPPTTLKYRGDKPEPPTDSLVHRWTGYFCTSNSETPRPTASSANFLVDDDRDPDLDWEPSKSSQDPRERPRPWFVNPEDDEELDRGPHLTSSDIFLPYDEGENYNGGILDRVVDTVNTARDIAHVIWNVGWRR